MKKIEPVAWLQYPRKKPELAKPSLGSRLPVALKGSGWISVPLWTDDALQAVAEAVRDAVLKAACAFDGNVLLEKPIDLAAIINQLKGE